MSNALIYHLEELRHDDRARLAAPLSKRGVEVYLKRIILGVSAVDLSYAMTVACREIDDCALACHHHL